MLKMDTASIQHCPESDVIMEKRPVSLGSFQNWPESETGSLRGLRATKSGSLCDEGFLMRQKYLRSYKFSRDEDEEKKNNFVTKSMKSLKKKKDSSIREIKEFRKAFSIRVFRVLLPCGSRVHVDEDNGDYDDDLKDSPWSSTLRNLGLEESIVKNLVLS